MKSSFGMLLSLAICGGFALSARAQQATEQPADVIGGGAGRAVVVQVAGLGANDAIKLTNNGADALSVTANGPYKFKTLLPDGAKYLVSATAPFSPNLSCTAENPSGVISGEDAVVKVSCARQAPSAHVQQVNGSQAAIGQSALDETGGNGAADMSASGGDTSPALALPEQAASQAAGASSTPALDTSGGALSGDNLALPNGASSAQASNGAALAKNSPSGVAGKASSKSPQAQQGQSQQAGGVKPDGEQAPTHWTCYTVDDPGADGRANEILGINLLEQITGNMYPPGQHHIFVDPQTFVYHGPNKSTQQESEFPEHYSNFIDLAQASGIKGLKNPTVLGISDESTIAGHFTDSSGKLNGFAYDFKTKTFTNEGSTLLTSVKEDETAINEKGRWGALKDTIAAGYNQTSGDIFLVDITKGQSTPLQAPPPSLSNMVPTGMCAARDKWVPVDKSSVPAYGMVGNYNGGIWYYEQSVSAKGVTYRYSSFPNGSTDLGATKIFASGVNWQRDIVGTYIDSGSKKHGFVLYSSNRSKNDWTSFDCNPSGLPKGVTVTSTRIKSNNDKDVLAGSYTDSNNKIHGFVAVPSKN